MQPGVFQLAVHDWRTDFRYTNFRYTDFRYTDFRYTALLRCTDFRHTECRSHMCSGSQHTNVQYTDVLVLLQVYLQVVFGAWIRRCIPVRNVARGIFSDTHGRLTVISMYTSGQVRSVPVMTNQYDRWCYRCCSALRLPEVRRVFPDSPKAVGTTITNTST